MKTTLYLGDCLSVLRGFPDGGVDITVTSPPYDDLRTYTGYSWDFELIAKELYRVTKRGGIVVWVVNDATHNGSESGTSFRQALYFKDVCGFNLHDTMIWEKPNFSNPSKTRYHQLFEYMFILSKGKPSVFNPIKDKVNKYKTCVGVNTGRNPDGSMTKRRRNECGEFGMRSNIWKMNTVGQDMMCRRPPHPAMFPLSLARDNILSWSNVGDTVLDPFMGSGTTGIACKDTNRNFIGIEISNEYFEIAKARIENIPDKLI